QQSHHRLPQAPAGQGARRARDEQAVLHGQVRLPVGALGTL
ncbi:MAG: hypothetical protein AVDCRST_MAG51-314, partial [uncultured Ramlibacter sp.]